MLLVPGTALARRQALSACRAAAMLTAGTTRKNALRAVAGPPLRHGGMARHGTKLSSCLIGLGRLVPCLLGLGPESGRAARLESYSFDCSGLDLFQQDAA